MNNLMMFSNEEFGSVRIVEVNNDIWFVGKDVAEILGYAEPRSAVSKKVDDEDKGVSKIATPSGAQEMTVINESGLYSLIMSSKLPNAKKFKRWVTSEVLPSIRKTGSYGNQTIETENIQEIIIKTVFATIEIMNDKVQYQNVKDNVPKKQKRCNGKIDRLKPYIKTSVEQMLMEGCTYKEIVEFLESNGEKMSQMAVCTYAKKFFNQLKGR